MIFSRHAGLALLALTAASAVAQSAPQPIAQPAFQTLVIPGSADFLAAADSEAWVTNRGRIEKLTIGATATVATVTIARACGGMEIAHPHPAIGFIHR